MKVSYDLYILAVLLILSNDRSVFKSIYIYICEVYEYINKFVSTQIEILHLFEIYYLIVTSVYVPSLQYKF